MASWTHRKKKAAIDPQDAPFWDHLEEFRRRLIYAVLTVVIAFIGTSLSSKALLEFLMAPLMIVLPADEKKIHFTGLIEPFFTYLKVALIAAIFVSMPLIFYQAWRFVAPGLYRDEKRIIIPLILGSGICFVGGGIFGYTVVLPLGFEFFLSFASETIRPILTMSQYLTLSLRLLIAFGVVFETPLVIFLLSVTGVVNPYFFLRYWRYAVVGVAIISAILTPADVGTMVMMAGPLLAMYFVSALVAIPFYRKRVAQEHDPNDGAPGEDAR